MLENKLEYYSFQGIVGVFQYSEPIPKIVASLDGLQDLIEANWSRVKIAVESVWKFVEILQKKD